MDFSPKQPWLHDALNTLAEALALGASLHLDIDPGELSSGYRLVPARGNEDGAARYFSLTPPPAAQGMRPRLARSYLMFLIVQRSYWRYVETNLAIAHALDCLRHYGNRFIHARLDRHLALDLLRFARRGEIPDIESVAQQSLTLNPLAARFLDWRVFGTISTDFQQEQIAHPC